MSWDAEFGGLWWNYTHNTNRMIAAAYEAVTGEATAESGFPVLGPIIGPAWWERLDGMTGREGAEYLGAIIKGLEADPESYRAMDPPNGWGSYGGVLEVLRQMRDAGAATCCDAHRWKAAG